MKTIKKENLVVGDYVEIRENEYNIGKYIITRVLPRKNSIPRPKLANLDKLFILIAPEPKPDFLLVDKLIIYCSINNIEPIIIINKCDIASDQFINGVYEQYKDNKIYVISAKSIIGIDKVKEELLDTFSAVCGQSAVGKSSFINAIMPELALETQGLSEKIQRGKHTTRVNQVFIANNFMIADTPGFSSLELNIDYRDLSKYYNEFENYECDCKYLDCSHIKEGKDCGVYLAVNEGKINKDRYTRYIDLYNKLKEIWENKYD